MRVFDSSQRFDKVRAVANGNDGNTTRSGEFLSLLEVAKEVGDDVDAADWDDDEAAPVGENSDIKNDDNADVVGVVGVVVGVVSVDVVVVGEAATPAACSPSVNSQRNTCGEFVYVCIDFSLILFLKFYVKNIN